MRKVVAANLLVLILHVAGALLVRPYGDFLVDIGLRVLHRHGIEDIPELFAAGLLIVGGLLFLATSALVWAMDRVRRSNST